MNNEEVCIRKDDVRSAILEKALKIATVGREEQYGSPENNFGRIANLWNDYLGGIDYRELRPHDVAAMMILMKISRVEGGNFKEDNWVDIAGYAACGGECEASEGNWRQLR